MNKAWAGLYSYDPTSITGLRYVHNKRNSRGSTVTRAGGVAGTVQVQGHCAFKLDGKMYSAHQVIWEMFNGEIPYHLNVDHKDGDRANNTITNLRLVTKEGNARNRGKSNNNSSGVVGVTRHTSGRWFANWSEGGRQRCKSFREGDFEGACEFRRGQLERMNLAGAGYTERHINGN